MPSFALKNSMLLLICLLQLTMSEPIGSRSSQESLGGSLYHSSSKRLVDNQRVTRNYPTLGKYQPAQSVSEAMTTEVPAVDTSESFPAVLEQTVDVGPQSSPIIPEQINSFIAAPSSDEIEQPAVAQLPLFYGQPTANPTVFETPQPALFEPTEVHELVLLPVTESAIQTAQAVQDDSSFNLDLKSAQQPLPTVSNFPLQVEEISGEQQSDTVVPEINQAPVVDTQAPLEILVPETIPAVKVAPAAELPVAQEALAPLEVLEPSPEPLPVEPVAVSLPESIQVAEIISAPADAPLELEPPRLEEAVAAAPVLPLEVPAPVKSNLSPPIGVQSLAAEPGTRKANNKYAASSYGFSPSQVSHTGTSQQVNNNFPKRVFGTLPTPRALGFPPITNTRENLFHDVNWSKVGRPYRSINSKSTKSN